MCPKSGQDGKACESSCRERGEGQLKYGEESHANDGKTNENVNQVKIIYENNKFRP